MIGSGNGLAPHKQEAINWVDDDKVHWPIYVSLFLNILINIKWDMAFGI